MQRSRDVEIQKLILRTLIYADLFDYPLTEKEIIKWSCGRRIKNSELRIKEGLNQLINNSIIEKIDGYFFLKGRGKIVKERRIKEKYSEEKLEIARKTAKKLQNISGVKMVGVTGALAMKNCSLGDDIDLAIITTKDRLWLTRLMILFLSPFLGIKRRKPKETNVRDKICFNLFLDEEYLRIEPENLFIAHEICQIAPLINKDKTYEKFLWENRWVKKYLPNAFDGSKCKVQSSKLQFKTQNCFSLVLGFFDKVFYKFQFWYMKPKITNEIISYHQAFFHPRNLGGEIERKYRQKTKKML